MNPKKHLKALIGRMVPARWRNAVLDRCYALHEEILFQTARYRRQSFVFNGKAYRYFCHRFNHAFMNERTVEIPIASRLLNEFQGRRILEVGNVLRHYLDSAHLVVDKYERAPGVINIDICDYEPAERFDLVVSLSTFEHIGFDEGRYAQAGPAVKVTASGALAAIEKTRKLLAPGGVFLLTFPLGYNPGLDAEVAADDLGMSEIFFLKRISQSNLWQQVEFEEFRGIQYGKPFYPGANGLVIARYEKA